MKENKLENLIWIVFTCIGTISLIIGLVIVSNVFNYKNKVETTGIITEISRNRNYTKYRNKYKVFVSYTVEGKEYESILKIHYPNFYEGKEIEIYYDKNDPTKLGMKSSDLILIIFPLFGLVFFIIGVIGIFVKTNNKKLEKKLKENGKLIYADYVKTVLNEAFSVNKKHPYNIICEWNNPEDNEKYTFKSKNMWINPEKLIEEKNIKTLPVYINLENKNQYFIDIDILAKY